jgi:hypothetical protein
MWQVISTSIIGVASVFISYQQWRIAEIRLRHDRYERLYKIYGAAKALLVVIQNDAKVSLDEYFNYLRGVADAEFVFDDADVVQYLQILRERAADLRRAQAQGAADECAKIESWFIQQFDVLRAKFRPIMGLRPPSMAERVRRWFPLASLKR